MTTITTTIKPLKKMTLDNVKGETEWIVREDYIDTLTGIKIPAGFKTDLSSVPSIFWPSIPAYGLGTVAPVVHDYMYRNAGKTFSMYHNDGSPWGYERAFTKKQADKYFRIHMRHEGIGHIKRFLAYNAVKFFAGCVWKRHLKKNIGK